jgi:hypothetical protein
MVDRILPFLLDRASQLFSLGVRKSQLVCRGGMGLNDLLLQKKQICDQLHHTIHRTVLYSVYVCIPYRVLLCMYTVRCFNLCLCTVPCFTLCMYVQRIVFYYVYVHRTVFYSVYVCRTVLYSVYVCTPYHVALCVCAPYRVVLCVCTPYRVRKTSHVFLVKKRREIFDHG